jgi:hypothetical protein
VDKIVKDHIEKAENKANDAAMAWLKENEKDLDVIVRKMLDRRLEMIVCKLLGFDSRWGGWTVDHCNGRGGESAAGDWLKEKAADAVRDWLTEQAGKLPNLPAKAAADLRAEYLKTFEKQMHKMLQEKAIADARAEIARICAV